MNASVEANHVPVLHHHHVACGQARGQNTVACIRVYKAKLVRQNTKASLAWNAHNPSEWVFPCLSTWRLAPIRMSSVVYKAGLWWHHVEQSKS